MEIEIKEQKRNITHLLKMIYPKVESISAKSLIFRCLDMNGKIHLYINNEEMFINEEISDIKLFKTLIAVQLNNEVIVIDKINYSIVSRHLGCRMTIKRTSDKTPFALLEMYDTARLVYKIVIYNIKTRKVAGLYDGAEWKCDESILSSIKMEMSSYVAIG